MARYDGYKFDKRGMKRAMQSIRKTEDMANSTGDISYGNRPISKVVRDAKITAGSTVTGGYSYTVRLGHFDMSTLTTSGGAWVEDFATNLTAFYPGSLTIGSYVQVLQRGWNGSSQYFDVVGALPLITSGGGTLGISVSSIISGTITSGFGSSAIGTVTLAPGVWLIQGAVRMICNKDAGFTINMSANALDSAPKGTVTIHENSTLGGTYCMAIPIITLDNQTGSSNVIVYAACGFPTSGGSATLTITGVVITALKLNW